MGVHTGDSITVAPAQTLTDREYQRMRDAALACIRAIGVETGGSNIQFAVDPRDRPAGRHRDEPARLALVARWRRRPPGSRSPRSPRCSPSGYTLDEIPNDITGETPAAFEPTLDYVVVKIPRLAFEKFPEADPDARHDDEVGGEVMAIGRTFKEALGKAWRSLERPDADLGGAPPGALAGAVDGLARRDRRAERAPPAPASRRRCAAGSSVDEVALASRGSTRGSSTRSRRWSRSVASLDGATLGDARSPRARARQAARALGPPARRSSRSLDRGGGAGAPDVARRRARVQDGRHLRGRVRRAHAVPLLDLRGGGRGRDRPTARAWSILGAGPNRIGQGIEFDYACVHAAFALGEAGFETVMVNSNPETVSTDYDTSDRLYFEPLSTEDVLAVCRGRAAGRRDRASSAGRRRCELARDLEAAGFPVLGTPRGLDRPGRGSREVRRAPARARHPGARRTARRTTSRRPAAIAARIGYPVVVRPSYVLGGRAMEIVYDEDELERFVASAAAAGPDHPVLIDRFLEGAIEVDVDAVCDGTDVFVGAVMEHIEEAGVHSGDSSCQIPPATLSDDELDEIERITRSLARRLDVRRPDQPAARGQGRADLGPRGEPARVAYRAVRVQGDRGAAREGRDVRPAGPDARRAPRRGGRAGRTAALPAAAAHGGEGGRAARSAASRGSTPCSGRRCARPAR